MTIFLSLNKERSIVDDFFSISLITRLNKHLIDKANNIKIYENQSLVLPCNNPLKNEVFEFIKNKMNQFKENYTYNIQWFHNNDVYLIRYNESNTNKIKQTIDVEDTLNIPSVDLRDRGVHICVGVLNSTRFKKRIVFEAYALVVIGTVLEYDYEIYSGQELKLPCYSNILVRIFNNLDQNWYHNGYRIENITTRSYAAALNLYYPKTSYLQSGIYECQVEDRIHKLKWTTNQVNVNIISLFWFIYSVKFWIAVGCIVLFIFSIWLYASCKKCQKISKYDALLNENEHGEEIDEESCSDYN